MASEQKYHVSIMWRRTTQPNVTTSVTVWAPDPNTAIAVAVCSIDRPTDAVGLANPMVVEVTSHGQA